MEMEKETMRQLLRERQAGFEALHAFEVEEWRRATPQERWRDVNDLYATVLRYGMRWRPDDASEVRERWKRLRELYGYG